MNGSVDAQAPTVSSGGSGGDESPQRPPFRPDIQGLRMVAVVLVVVYHSGVGVSGGFLGVDVFFVISGFVIGRLLTYEQASTGTIALGRFYARRVRRLLPAMAAMVGVVALVSILGTSPFGALRDTLVKTGFGSVLYVANFALLAYQKTGYFDLDATTNPLLHTWTLAVEEQFYLFFPLVLLVIGRLARRRRHPGRVLVVVLGVAAVASFVVGAVMSGAWGAATDATSTHARFAFYSSPTRAWEFLAGVLVALAAPTFHRITPRVAGWLVAAGGVLIIGAAWRIDAMAPTPGPSTLVPVLGAALVIVGGAVTTKGVSRWLASGPAVWIGDRSYGWYLWHWPAMVLVRMSFPTVSSWTVLAVGVLALVPTELSYRYLEQPIRRNAWWSGRRAVGLALGCMGAAAVCLVVLSTFPKISTAGTRRVTASVTPTTHQTRSCLTATNIEDPKYSVHCTWPVAHPRGKIVLVGDSHAGALARVMADVATRHGYELSLAYRPGCPFGDVERLYDDPGLTADCRDFYETTMGRLVLTHPDLVVLASRQDSYVGLSEFRLRDPVTGAVGRSTAAKAALWQRGLTRTLQRLTAGDVPPVVVATVPQLAPFNVFLCPSWRLWTKPSGCARTLSRAAVDRSRRPGASATRTAVANVPDAHLVDFTDDLCLPSRCSTLRDDWWIYQDSTHVSQHGAATLAPRIAADVLPHSRDAAATGTAKQGVDTARPGNVAKSGP